jgi:hypothetical protein
VNVNLGKISIMYEIGITGVKVEYLITPDIKPEYKKDIVSLRLRTVPPKYTFAGCMAQIKYSTLL